MPCDLWITLIAPTLRHHHGIYVRLHWRRVVAMRCLSCGAEMHLVEVRRDDSMMVRGYEHHTFECTGCPERESRLTFSPAKGAPTGRIVQVCHDPHENTYTAKDTKSGMVVMRNPDRQRLWELCEWIGWRVLNEKVSATN